MNVERRAGSSQVEDARVDVQIRERHSASWHVIERASGLNTGSEDQMEWYTGWSAKGIDVWAFCAEKNILPVSMDDLHPGRVVGPD